MGRTTAFHGASWHEIARGRARDVGGQFLFAVLIALSGAFASHGAAWPFLWLAAVAAAQGLSLAITEPMRRNPSRPASVRRERAFFLTVALTAATFASSGALFWFSGGWGERLFAAMLLAGGALNVALRPGASVRLVCVGCAPFMTLLLVLPVISFFTAPTAERGGMGMAALSAALFVVHLISAVRRSVVSSRRLEAALKRARRERRRAEAARTEKKDFMGLMSHELRTPLNGVLGMAQAMQIEPLTAEQRDRLEVIRNSGEILRTLLNDVLEAPEFEAADAGDVAPAADLGWGERRLRVLAAEDNPTNQLVLRTLLGQAGIEIHVVGDGEQAVEAWRGANWDLVLMDIRMPVMDGLAATRAIRAAERATGRRRTPIIAVSAEATTRAASDSLAAGIDCFVPKPIHFGQLATAMAAAIEAASGQDERGAARG